MLYVLIVFGVNLTDIFSNRLVSDLKRLINLADELDDEYWKYSSRVSCDFTTMVYYGVGKLENTYNNTQPISLWIICVKGFMYLSMN